MLRRRERLPNPGRTEELKKEAQGIMTLDVFDGARFEFNKSPSNKFGLSHNVTLPPTPSPAAYEFGANFGDEHVLFASRLDMQGRMNGRINAQLGDSVLLRLQAQLQPDQPTPTSWKADVDYKGGSFCAGGSYIGGGLLQGHYLQSVTESLALGAEGLYHVHRPITGLTGVARCVWGGKGDNVLTAKSSTLGSHELAYSRKVGLERSRARARARTPPCTAEPLVCPAAATGEREGRACDGAAVPPQPAVHIRARIRVQAAPGDLQGAGAERHDMLGNARGAHPAGRLDALLWHAQPQEEGLQVRLRPDSRRAVMRRGATPPSPR